MWSKAYLLALMIIGCTCIVGLAIGILEVIFNTRISGLSLLIQTWSGFIIGGFYSKHQGIFMPRILKIKTSLYYALISILITPITLAVLNIHIPRSSGILYQAVLFSVLGLIFVYWGLSFGSRTYMKRTKKVL
jgi:hypothetical protein